jgi:anti-sigma B factor antagonist
MQLRLESRPVGDVLIVQCKGRIVLGNEVLALHHLVQESFAKYVDIVLQLDQVEYVDSSGLGALVRLTQAARAKGGDLKLSGVPPNIHKTLAMTHLLSQFETYDCMEEAITAAYLGSRYSRGKVGDTRPTVLCIYDSADVRTFLREVLCSAGYNALTAGSVSDARVLLKATKAKLVVLSAHQQSAHGQPTRNLLEEVDPAVNLHVLDEGFAGQDPGESAEQLLSAISAH